MSAHQISNSDDLSFGSTNSCNDIYKNFTNNELPTSSTELGGNTEMFVGINDCLSDTNNWWDCIRN